MYTLKDAPATWIFDHDNEPELWDNFWESFDALPVGSIVATGFVDEGVLYYRKDSDTLWTIVQIDNILADAFTVGEQVGGDVVDAGGGIEVAYVVREGE